MTWRSMICLTTFAVGTALAQPAGSVEARAKIEFDAAVAALDAGDHTAALAAFRRSYALVPRAKTLANIGALQQQLGQLVDAAESFDLFLEDETASDADRTKVRRRLAELDAQLGRIAFEIETTSPLTLDGRDLGTGPLTRSVRVTPGRHEVTIGERRAPLDVQRGGIVPVVELERARPTIVVKPPPPVTTPVARSAPTEDRARPWWIATSVLVVADAAAVTYLGLRARRRVRDAEALGRLPFEHDYSEARVLVDGAGSDVRWMKIGIGVGAGLTVVTGLLLWRWHRDRPDVTTTVDASSRGLAVTVGATW